ncbi:hypothetical protein K435DRAFT_849154 [Dendrothele bispora CBS 962.96]|uniref:Uncharacterized protein n=1 Tax=Dendrothele bispora (strain CBS 962.96) TaxID=1314807 RepID=A0A4S8MUI6_DENBC|nr:hypothetical protein K435DRAFT_849154 [Dendrothele bispora CBS 962.96]
MRLPGSLDGVSMVQDRLGQRLIELALFALLAYRGNPIQIFLNLYEMLDGIFTRTYEATICVHGGEKDAALESLESLVTRLETFQSFLRRAEAVSRRFVGDNRDRSQNERFLLSNIPPQSSPRPTFTPPNTPADSNARGSKRPREELMEDGEISAKRRR